MRSFIFRFQIQTPGRRVDLLLLDALKKWQLSLSRVALKKIFQERKILYRKQAIASSWVPDPGLHEVEWQNWDPSVLVPPRASPALNPGFLPAIYEDEEILVLNKRSHIPSVPLEPTETETAVGEALARFPAIESVGRGGLEPGILHRLDTQTSGLLVFAKNQKEYERLRTAWKKREVRKVYRALIKPPEAFVFKPMDIRLPIAHDAHSAKRMQVVKKNSGKAIRGAPLPALTRLLSCHPITASPIAKPPLYDLEIQIETGVMHQIRCHLSAIQCPIIGDRIYKGLPSERLWLHAWRLEIPLRDGARLKLQAALPERWEAASSST